jgi:hypothetical protein
VEYYPALGDFHLVSRAAGPTSHFGKKEKTSTQKNCNRKPLERFGEQFHPSPAILFWWWPIGS